MVKVSSNISVSLGSFQIGPGFGRSEAFTLVSLVRNECAVSNAKLPGSLRCEAFPSRPIYLMVKLPGHFCPETLPRDLTLHSISPETKPSIGGSSFCVAFIGQIEKLPWLFDRAEFR